MKNDHIPDDIKATGRFVVLKENDPKAKYKILQQQFAKVKPVTVSLISFPIGLES